MSGIDTTEAVVVAQKKRRAKTFGPFPMTTSAPVKELPRFVWECRISIGAQATCG